MFEFGGRSRQKGRCNVLHSESGRDRRFDVVASPARFRFEFQIESSEAASQDPKSFIFGCAVRDHWLLLT
jgi:hypothetical protein